MGSGKLPTRSTAPAPRLSSALLRFLSKAANQYHQIVLPTALWVTNDVGYDRLVLSACNPLYSAAQRIIVFAKLSHVEPLGAARGSA